MVKVKICGITNIDDAKAAVDFGADAIGFIFFKNSPRCVSLENAVSITEHVPPFTTRIGVFVDEAVENIEKIVSAARLDVIQLHGDEAPEMRDFSRRIIKAIRIKSLESLDLLYKYKNIVSAFVLDTYTPDILGGTGQVFNWDIAVEAKKFGRIILAGGLSPDNISDAIRHVQPYAVDVCSGIELEKGKKDHKKMKLFIERAKSAL